MLTSKKTQSAILILITILAFFLRFYQLGKVPLSMDWDENSNAYNAFSILKTGKDEYGSFLPLTNRSFDDFKPPLYMYLNVITVKLFGLTPIAARLPSAFFGTLTVPLIYFLARWLFQKKVEVKEKCLLLEELAKQQLELREFSQFLYLQLKKLKLSKKVQWE